MRRGAGAEEGGEQPDLPGTKSSSTGRRNQDGTEEVPNFIRIKDGTKELMRSYKKLEQAREAFNDIAKALAERGNVNAANLKRLCRASASGNFADHRRMIDQQAALFDVVGELPGGGTSPE